MVSSPVCTEKCYDLRTGSESHDVADRIWPQRLHLPHRGLNAPSTQVTSRVRDLDLDSCPCCGYAMRSVCGAARNICASPWLLRSRWTFGTGRIETRAAMLHVLRGSVGDSPRIVKPGELHGVMRDARERECRR